MKELSTHDDGVGVEEGVAEPSLQDSPNKTNPCKAD